MNRNRLISLIMLIIVVSVIGAGAVSAQAAISITLPTNSTVVDTNQLVDVAGTYANLPVDGNIFVQFRTSPGDVIVGDRVLTLDGAGNWFANDMSFNIAGSVPYGTPGTIIAYARAADNSVLATSNVVSVTWGSLPPTSPPTTIPTNTPTATPTATLVPPTNTPTPTATATTGASATPTATRTPSLTPPPPATITITSPINNTIFPTNVLVSVSGVSSNILANGLTVRALNANNDVLSQATVVPGAGGNWIVNLQVSVPTGTRGFIYAFATRPGDGLVYASNVIAVTYGGPCVIRTDWQTYVVQPGDTLFRIANRVGSTVNDLALANCLDNTNAIFAGQQLRVPRLPVPPVTPDTRSLVILAPQGNSVVDTSQRVAVIGGGRGIGGYTIVVRALNPLGEVLAQQVAVANADSGWTVALFISTPTGTRGTLYAYAVIPSTGAVVADYLVNVTFGAQPAATPTPAPIQPTPSQPTQPIEGAVEVILNTPAENQTFVLANPLVNGRVIGVAEGTINLRALDAEGNVLAEAASPLTRVNANESSWQFPLPFDAPAGARVTIFAYVSDPLLGGIAGSDAVNVVVGESTNAPVVTLRDPLPYAIVPLDAPLTIRGYGARLFEGTVVVRVLDDEGGVLAETATIIDSPNAGTGGEGEWAVTLDVNVAAGTRGSVYAFATSAQDGSIVAAARRYVTFGDPSSASNFVQITTPLPGTLISPQTALLIAGRANQGGSLTVQIFDELGNVLIEEPRPISAVQGTNYGTWEVILELQNLQAGTRLRVNAFTTSTFDGSILASDSVALTYGSGE